MPNPKRKRYSDASPKNADAAKGAPNGTGKQHARPAAEPAQRTALERDTNKFEVRWQKSKNGVKPPKRRKLSGDWTDGKDEPGIEGARLAGRYQIKPGNLWNQLVKYRNFLVSPHDDKGDYDETKHKFQVGDFVFVNHTTEVEDDADSETDERQNWVARIAEVRAASPEAVFIRVLWMYWPEELPGGKEIHHGRRELVASNLMDILDAMTVDGKAKVVHYRQDPRDKNRDRSLFGNLEPDTYYWRQTFNTQTSKLSALPKDCHCKQVSNLDQPLYQCPHDGCKRWFHAHCLRDAALEQYWQRIQKEKAKEGQVNGHVSDGTEVVGNGVKAEEEESEMGDTIVTTPRKPSQKQGSFFKNLLSTLSGQKSAPSEETTTNSLLASQIKQKAGSAPARKGSIKKGIDTGAVTWKEDFASELVLTNGRFTGKARIWPANLSQAAAAEQNLLETVQVSCMDDKCAKPMAASTELSDGAAVNGDAADHADGARGQGVIGSFLSDVADKARATSGFDAVKDAALGNSRPEDASSAELDGQVESPLVTSKA